jgi:hypothetical protein
MDGRVVIVAVRIRRIPVAVCVDLAAGLHGQGEGQQQQTYHLSAEQLEHTFLLHVGGMIAIPCQDAPIRASSQVLLKISSRERPVSRLLVPAQGNVCRYSEYRNAEQHCPAQQGLEYAPQRSLGVAGHQSSFFRAKTTEETVMF